MSWQSEYDAVLADLARERAPAIAAAERLFAERRYAEADEIVVAADSSIFGAVALGRLYQAHLERLVAAGEVEADRAHAEDVFRRGLAWAQSAYPEPHTGIEAESYASGRADDRARLVRVLGYDPDER